MQVRVRLHAGRQAQVGAEALHLLVREVDRRTHGTLPTPTGAVRTRPERAGPRSFSPAAREGLDGGTSAAEAQPGSRWPGWRTLHPGQQVLTTARPVQ